MPSGMPEVRVGEIRKVVRARHGRGVAAERTMKVGVGELRKVVRVLAGTLFVVSVPIALVFSNVRWMVGDAALYHDGYVKYGVPRTTGMTIGELDEATRQIQRYFATGAPMTIEIDKGRGPEPLYNARERQHLADVRSLLNILFTAQTLAIVVVVLFVAASPWLLRPRPLRRLAWHLAGGAGLTIAILTVLGLLAQADFESLFVQFHELSFNNDLWILDPRTDWMIRMYPEGFWYDAAIRLAVWTCAEAAAVLVAAWMLVWRPQRLTKV